MSRAEIEQTTQDLLLKAKKHYRVTSPIIARHFFRRFMEAGKSERGYRVRFVEIPEKCAIEIQANDDYDLRILERVMVEAKIIKHTIPFEVHNVIKLGYGRRDGRDFGAMN